MSRKKRHGRRPDREQPAAGAAAGAGSASTAAEEAAPPPPTPLLSPGRILLIALCSAVWAGLAEEIPVFVAPYGHVIIRLSNQAVWMTPTGDVLFFGVAALVLLALGVRWPGLRSRHIVIGVFAGMATLAVGLVPEAFYASAIMLLAIGVGFEVSRHIHGPARRPRRLPMATGLGLLIVLLLTLQVNLGESYREKHELASLPAARAGSPNVVLLILDTVRAASLDILNGPGVVFDSPGVHAAVMDSLAAHAVLYTHAIAPAPWTLPSHAAMFTGHRPVDLSAGWTHPLGDRFPTVAGILTAHGYDTGGFVGNLLFTAREMGLARGFIHYEDYPVSLGQTLLSCAIGRRLAGSNTFRDIIGYQDLFNRKPAGAVVNEFLHWQAGDRSRPFFAFLNFFDAHEPYFPPDSVRRHMPPGSHWDRFDHYVGLLKGSSAGRSKKWLMNKAEARANAAGYDAAILHIDAQIGRLLDTLRRRGVLKNTVVILVSDHGEQLGEHGLFRHGNSLYMPSLHVPLIIDAPGDTPAGLKVRRVVNLRNIAATILDFAGLNAAALHVPGRSLTADWRDLARDDGPHATDARADTAPAPDSVVFSALRRAYQDQPWYPDHWGQVMFSLTDSVYQYIRNGDGTDELFDLKTDPAEMHNLVGDPADIATVTHFRVMLDGMAPHAPPLNTKPVEHPQPPKVWGARKSPAGH